MPSKIDDTAARGPTSNRTLLIGFVALAVALLALIALTSIGFVKLHDQAASQGQLERVVLRGCQRENSLRRSDNAAHYGDYIVFSFVVKRFLVPTHTQTPEQQRVTQEFSTALHRAVAKASWTPVTDCTRTIGEQGYRYTPPAAVAFSVRLPPRSALP